MRLFVSSLLGVVVALALFVLMHSLISGDSDARRDNENALRLDFIQVDQSELENIRNRRKPPPPEPPKEPPPPPKLEVQEQSRPQQNMPQIEMPHISVGVGGAGPYLGSWSAGDPAADGDVIPIVRINPQYPREALIEGITGWVDIEFTIEPDGSVSGPKIIDAKPKRVFDRSAVRAIYKWKFKPRVIDGGAVARRATTRIEFGLDE